MTPRLDAQLTYRHAKTGGKLEVTRLAADPLGGKASASGWVALGRRPRLGDVRVEASALDLGQIPGTGGLLAGGARLKLTASGAYDRPRGSVEMDLDKVTWHGVPLGGGTVRASSDERRGVSISRLSLGQTVNVSGTVGWGHLPLALDVDLKDLPLSLVPMKELELDGRISADLKVGGTAKRPTASGTLLLAGLQVMGTILGSGSLKLTEEPGGRVRVSGRLFQNKLGIEGTVAAGGPFGIDADVILTVHKLDLDEVLAAQLDRIGAHGWVSGTIHLWTAPKLVAEARLSAVHVELDGSDAEGRPAPVVIENAGPIAARYDAAAEEVRLLEPAVFRSETGSFSLEGSASRQALAVQLRGDIQLRILELYTRRWIDRARGNLTVDVTVGGSAAKPTLDGKVAFQEAAVVPREQEAEVEIPAGEITFSMNQVAARALTVEVDGQRLTLDGECTLAAWKPVAIEATATGRIAGKLIEMIAPAQITHAGGSAKVQVSVKGKATNPTVQGEIEIDRRLEIAPRALRREIILGAGRITFSQQRVTLLGVSGLIDDASLAVSGGATISPKLTAALRLDVDGLSHRVPGVLEVELSAGVNVTYDGEDLTVRGDIDIIDGRYAQQLEFSRLASNIAFPSRTIETSEPFWKGSPLLANMQLDLDVNTKAPFAVANELVSLTLDGRVQITGTPPRPVLHGTVESRGEGIVRLPGTKIREFAVSQGRVDFSRYATFPTTTPTVLLSADAPFVDLTGTEHRVFLEISGTLSRYEWKLWTSTGLNQAQTFELITFGRVTGELRATMRGTDGQGVSGELSRGPTMTATGSATDEVLNELSGDVIDALIADTLRGLLSLDCFNLSVSGTSVRASACKKLGAIFTLTGQYEQGLGWYRYDAGLTLRPADDLSFVLQGWGVKSVQETEEIQNALRLQLKYNFILR